MRCKKRSFTSDDSLPSDREYGISVSLYLMLMDLNRAGFHCVHEYGHSKTNT